MTASDEAWFAISALLILISLPLLYRALRAPVGIDCDERVPTERQTGIVYGLVSLVFLTPVFLFWWVVFARGI
jgi:hypothetical protein